MSENAETVRHLDELYERGDVDGMLARVDPNLEFDVSDRLPAGLRE